MGIPQDGTTPGCSRSQIEWGVCKGWIGVFTSSRGSLLPSKPTPKALHENCFAGSLGEAAPLVPPESPAIIWPALPSSSKESECSLTVSQLASFSEIRGR